MSENVTVPFSVGDGQLGFDPEVLQNKYQAERNKRPDGKDQ